MNALATRTLTTPRHELLERATLEVADFARREGGFLLDLLDLLGDEDGLDAVMTLAALCDAPLPDPIAVSAELQEIRIALECVSFLHLDDLIRGGSATFDIYGAVRWAGARVSDHSLRLARLIN